MTAIFVFDTAMIQIFGWITQNLFQKKWNLTAKFNCLQAIYFDAPSALAVPYVWAPLHKNYRIFTINGISAKLW